MHNILWLRGLIYLFTLNVVSACAIRMPYSGPYESVPEADYTSTYGDEVLVAITNGYLVADDAEQERFWQLSGEVLERLPVLDGYVGGTVGRELLGRQIWTVTIWRDEQALTDFLEKDTVHLNAMYMAQGAIQTMRHARFTMQSKEIPPPWRRIEEEVGKQPLREVSLTQ